jgi:hypothetical protein
MGYYENPPIIQPGRGSEMISSAIVDASTSISRALIEKGERKRQEEKEYKLTLQKLQDRKNETDLYYNEKLSEWAVKQTHTDDVADKQIYSIMQDSIKSAADSRILLLNENDPNKRQEYLKNIRNANSLLEGSSTFAKSLAGQVATWKLDTKGSKVGVVGGHFVNGKDEDEIMNNTAGLEILGNMKQRYIDPKIDIQKDEDGDGLILTVTGKHKDNNKDINFKIYSKNFNKSETETEDGLLVPVESLDTFNTQAKETIVDKKGNIYDGFLLKDYETFDLDSKGTSGGNGRDIYQITGGRRLQVTAAKNEIRKKAEVTATGMIGADSVTRLKAMLNYTLEKGPLFYNEKFVVDEKGLPRSTESQKQMLTEMLTEKSFQNMVNDFEKTTTKEGVIYWDPTADVKLKDKPSNADLRGSGNVNKLDKNDNGILDSEENSDYRGAYYDNLIKGPKKIKGESGAVYAYRSRQDYAKNLNRLAGSTKKFVTSDDLYKLFIQEPYKDKSSKTYADQIKAGKLTKQEVKESFNSRFPKSDLYYEEGEGDYRPLTGYNVYKAASRARLALDFTAGEGEVKKLQGKIGQAELSDWITANPRKPGESDAQYVARYKNQ